MSNKFKVGDRIVIKSVEEIKNVIKIRKTYYIYRYISFMKQYSNFNAVIINIDIDGYLNIDISGNNYKWHPTWVKHNNLFEDKDFMI